MRLYIDVTTQRIVSAPGNRSAVNFIEFKRGDSARVEVQFVSGIVVQELDAAATGVLGIKAWGQYDAEEFLAADLGWAKEGAGTATVYVFEPNLNTTQLNTALNGGDEDAENDIAFVDAMFEIEWENLGGVYSTQTVTARIHHDVIKGLEGLPESSPGIDDFIAARAVLYDRAQALTDGQIEQAAENLGFPVYADLAAANAAEAAGVIFRNQATGKYEITTV